MKIRQNYSDFINLNIENIFSRIVSLIIIFFISRSLSIESLGIYSLVIAISVFLSNFADLSISPLLLQKLNKKKSKEITSLISFNILSSIAAVIISIIISLYFYHQYFTLIVYSSLSQVFLTICAVYISFFQFKNKISIWVLWQILYKLIYFLFACLAILVYQNLEVFFLISFLSALCYLVLLFYFIRKNIYPVKIQFNKINNSQSATKEILIFSTSMVLSALVIQLNTLIISSFGSLKELGFYSIAEKIILVFFSTGVIMSKLLLPKLLSACNSKNMARFKKVYLQYFSYMTVITAFLVIGIIFICPLFIKVIFGQKYIPAIPLTKLMVLYLIPYLLYIIPATALTALGKQKTNNILLLTAIFINLLLNSIFWNYFRLSGIIYFSGISFSIILLLSIYSVKLKLSQSNLT